MSGDTAMLQIGAIEILIGGDPSQLSAATKKVKSAFDDMQKGGTSTFNNLNLRAVAAAGGITAAFYKVTSAISETINTADQLAKTAQKLGVGVEQLELLREAADRTGVSFDTLTNGLRVLTLKMQDTQDGARIFNTLGVSIRGANGEMRSAADVMVDVSARFATFKDNADKTALAIQLFGKEGAELITMLNLGRDGIKAVGDEAKKTGDALDSDLIKQAQAFRDAWEGLTRKLQGGINILTKDLLPAMTSVVEGFSNLIKESTAFKNVIWLVGQTVKIAASSIIVVTEAVGELTTSITALANAATLIASGEFSKSWDALKQSVADNTKSWEEAKKVLEQIWTKELPQAAKEGANAVNDAMKGKINAPRIAGADEIARQIQIIRETSKDLPSELAALQKVLGINGDVINQNTAAWQQYNAAATAAAQAAQVIGQMDLQDILDSEGLRTAAEKMNALNDAVGRGVIGWRQYGQMAKAVADQNEANMNNVLSTTASTLTQVFQKSKTAAIAAALINTYQGITAALKVDPPYGFVLAGLVAAQGFAQVANIRSTSQSGGGGSSAGVASAAAAPVAPVAAASTQTLNVVGIDRKSLFSGDAVRDLAERLVEFQQDGGKVVIA
jgi:hypothetical protein